MPVFFLAADVPIPRFNKRKTTAWINAVAHKHKTVIKEISYVFCSDSYLLTINKQYLNRNTLTDIITFQLSEKDQPIEAEIYISVERVLENAKTYKSAFDKELHRVIIHGVLHLIGFKDKKPTEKALMRKTEEACLSLRK